MSKIKRLNDFKPQATVLSTPIDNELNQIVELLNGTGLKYSADFAFSHATIPVMIVNQLGAGPVAKFFKGGTLVAQVPNSGTPSANEDLVTKAFFDTKKGPFAFTFFFDGSMQAASKANTFVAPPTGIITVTGIRGQFGGGGSSGGAGTNSIVEIRKNGGILASDASITLTGTSTTTVFSVTLATPVALAAADLVTAVVTQGGNTLRTNVSISIIGTETLG